MKDEKRKTVITTDDLFSNLTRRKKKRKVITIDDLPLDLSETKPLEIEEDENEDS